MVLWTTSWLVMKETIRKVFLLLWKNWTIQKRNPKRLASDILIPFFVGGFLLFIRYEVELTDKPQIIYKPFDTKYLPPVSNRKVDFGGGNFNGSKILDLINATVQKSGNFLPFPFFGSNLTYASRQLPQMKWKLLWAPRHRLVDDIMQKACDDMGVIGNSVKDAATLEKMMMEPSDEFPRPRDEILAGVIFPEEILQKDDFIPDMDIKIRFPAEVRYANLPMIKMLPRHWMTGLIFPIFQIPGPREEDMNEGGSPGYYREGFLRVEDAISLAIFNHNLKKRVNAQDFKINLTRFPFSNYTIDPMITVMQQSLPIFIVLSFLFSVKTITEKITTEKEMRFKVVMNIMGLSDSLRWASWFVYSLIFFSVTVAVLILVFKVPLIYGTPLFPGSDWSCLALFFLSYISTATAFCFLISTMFSKAGVASTVAGMGWFLLFAPFYVIQQKYVEINLIAKCLASLLVNTGMGIGIHIILIYEGLGPGLQWDNINKPAIPDDEMTVALSLVFLMLDCVLYMCLALYIENVFPGEYGTPLPWYYPLQRSYWCREKAVIQKYSTDTKYDYPFEREPENLSAGIQIMNLTKIYGKNKKPAIENLNLNAFEGQITVLMGFNGAGKTTTLSILTGMYPPTSGTAVVAGYDIATNIKEMRKNLGFCPQYNVLFDDLNVEEHIQFYGKLKGLDSHQIVAETDKYINLLNLKDKSKTLSKHLSGGMKRKLSVALAMCGNTKVLIFDEPTAGMDPSARRSLWDLLISQKKGRTILITTHYLDEANLLGDKVAIMSEGKLNCCGSTFFLKNHFSCGYHLKIIKKDNCDVAKVTEIVQKYIPDNVKAEDVGMELSYRLPDEHSNKFKELFTVLENKREELKIIGFGVMPTTLEDVFMRISDDLAEKERQNKPSSNGVSEDVKVEMTDTPKVTGNALLLNQIGAMFFKHMKYTIRSWKFYSIMVLITICGALNAIFTIRLNNRLLDLPPRVLHLKDFPNGITSVKMEESCIGNCNKLYQSYMEIMKEQNMNVVQLNENVTDINDYLLEECSKSSYSYRNQHILATTFKITKTKSIEVNGWFNAIPYHTPPIALANIYNAMFRAFVDPDLSLTFTNEPLPYTPETKVDIQGMGIDPGFQIALFIAMTYLFVASFFIMFPIQEREKKAKLLQMISGVGAVTFWSVTLVWNLLISIAPNLTLLVTFTAFREEGFREPDELAYSGLILISFFVGVFPLIYLGSLLWSKPALGFTLLSFFSIITGVFSMLLIMILRIPTLNLTDIADALDWTFSVFPFFSLGRSIQNKNTASTRLKMCKSVYEKACLPIKDFSHICCKVPEKCPNGICLKWTESPLDWNEPGFGKYIFFLYATGIVGFILLLLIENGIFKFLKLKLRRSHPLPVDWENKDSDVAAEREKILNLPGNERENYGIILDGISKNFGKYTAVNNLYLTVKEGECFGLLGANGAGKTTTFRMLTGDEYPSSGSAYLKGLKLSEDIKKVHKLIGYCPQFDALIDDLTGREHLRIHCLIRGIQPKEVDVVSLKLARELLFEEHLDKVVKKYSGGNKRKLSTAIALIGNPPIVYLDEPTAGIDPVAKRHLWAVINKLRSQGTTIVLTSHSIDECEALCTKLTIMVKGEFKCLGTSQYLKNKFSQGYSVALKIRKNTDKGDENATHGADTKEIEKFVAESFPGAVQMEKHEELFVYRIPLTDNTLSKIFGVVESVKDIFDIEDYSVGQTTLEEILLKLTGSQTDQDE